MAAKFAFSGQSELVQHNTRAGNAGILALDIFFPQQYISQVDLEVYDKVSAGKYVIGLGQDEMAFCTTCQDIYSLMLSGVDSFMRKFNIDYKSIGRLEVGTETIMDHSKSIKSVLMQLFEESGNTDMEGIDCTNACYGGTNALFNSLNWIESSAWDGRYAMVVCGDIAEYAAGPARPTSGAGIVVMLLGANAPLVIDQTTRASHMAHAWDFYKPNMTSPFPVVDGHLSQTCYLNALDICFTRYCEKYQKLHKKPFDFQEAFDYMVFHAPYNKLVQKSYARLYYIASCLGFMQDADVVAQFQPYATLTSTDILPSAVENKTYTETLVDRNLEKVTVTVSKTGYQAKVAPTSVISKRVGNMYTGSLYASLLSLVQEVGAGLAGKNLLLFSYGSGLAASMFGITVGCSEGDKAALENIQKTADVYMRLDQRIKQQPDVMNACMDERASLHHLPEGVYVPQVATALYPGEFYLVEKNIKSQRQYARK